MRTESAVKEKIKAVIEDHLKAGNVVTDVDRLVNAIEEAMKPKGMSFPCEYDGWKVEIKMGHEFKGTRGSTRRSRGYVATKISTGEIQEFPPSAGNSVGFSTVRQWINLKKHMESNLEAQ